MWYIRYWYTDCQYILSFLCSEDGALYTFGELEGGKLGLGEGVEEQNTPQEVDSIDERVSVVSCGGSHTLAITGKGSTYCQLVNNDEFIKQIMVHVSRKYRHGFKYRKKYIFPSCHNSCHYYESCHQERSDVGDRGQLQLAPFH